MPVNLSNGGKKKRFVTIDAGQNGQIHRGLRNLGLEPLCVANLTSEMHIGHYGEYHDASIDFIVFDESVSNPVQLVRIREYLLSICEDNETVRCTS